MFGGNLYGIEFSLVWEAFILLILNIVLCPGLLHSARGCDTGFPGVRTKHGISLLVLKVYNPIIVRVIPFESLCSLKNLTRSYSVSMIYLYSLYRIQKASIIK